MTARVSVLLKSRASPDILPFRLCNKEILAIRHMDRPLFATTMDSVLRHREVGRANNLSAPLVVTQSKSSHFLYIIIGCMASTDNYLQESNLTIYAHNFHGSSF